MEAINLNQAYKNAEKLHTNAKNGTLKEIFGAGTAAVVTVIKGFSYQDEYYELTPVDHSFALDLKNKLTAIQHKLAEDTFGWTLKV
jgi:branched-chain amino acid aminotransferase